MDVKGHTLVCQSDPEPSAAGRVLTDRGFFQLADGFATRFPRASPLLAGRGSATAPRSDRSTPHSCVFSHAAGNSKSLTINRAWFVIPARRLQIRTQQNLGRQLVQ